MLVLVLTVLFVFAIVDETMSGSTANHILLVFGGRTCFNDHVLIAAKLQGHETPAATFCLNICHICRDAAGVYYVDLVNFGVERIWPSRIGVALCDGVCNFNAAAGTEQCDQACRSSVPPEKPSGWRCAWFGVLVTAFADVAGSKNEFPFGSPPIQRHAVQQPCEPKVASGYADKCGCSYPDGVYTQASRQQA